MGTFSDIDPIIALLYDGVINSGDWYDGLDAIAQAYGSVGFHYMAQDGQNAALLEAMATFELPAAKVHEYETHYMQDDPRMAVALRQPAGHSWADHDYLDKKLVSRAPIYTDLLIPNGACHTLALRIRADTERSEFVGFLRPADAPLIDEEDRQFLQRLTPHIQRASMLRTRMAELARHAALGLSALEHVPQGVAVVDGQGRIQHMNRVAQGYAQAGGPCCVRGSQLVFTQAAENAQFQRLLAAACAQGGQRPRLPWATPPLPPGPFGWMARCPCWRYQSFPSRPATRWRRSGRCIWRWWCLPARVCKAIWEATSCKSCGG